MCELAHKATSFGILIRHALYIGQGCHICTGMPRRGATAEGMLAPEGISDTAVMSRPGCIPILFFEVLHAAQSGL